MLALAPSPGGFTVADMTAKVHAMTGQTHATYNTRQAAYDLRKLRGKQLVGKTARSRRYYLPGPAARTISALLTLRDHVIAPILAGVQIRRHDHVPTRLTPIDQDYEHLRTDMARLFSGVACTPYMQFVLDANPEAERCLPAIVHHDRSSRLQSVDRSTGSPWMRAMLLELGALTGVAAMLNTSLNGPGEPIVETPDEAVRLLGAGVVDCLVVGDTLIAPRESPVPPALLG